MIYLGAGYIADGGGEAYEDGEGDAPEPDIYDYEFDEILSPDERDDLEERRAIQKESSFVAREEREVRGERATRREERTREHPQFAKRYEVEVVDLDKLREALDLLVRQPDTLGEVRWDDIHDAAGEVAGTAMWVGFGRDVSPLAIHEGLREALLSVGADVAQTLIGADNLRRGLERDGATIKQTFFRIFLPAPGWKLLSDWTILREGEKKSDLHPELQAMVRERQAARRLEIVRALRDVRATELREKQLAAERDARLRAEAEAEVLRRELARQDAALLAMVRAQEAQRATVAAPVIPPVKPPSGWIAAAERARARTKASVPVAPTAPVKPPSGWVAAAERADRQHQARLLDRRARYREDKAGTGRSRSARELRAEARELRAEARRLRSQ